MWKITVKTLGMLNAYLLYTSKLAAFDALDNLIASGSCYNTYTLVYIPIPASLDITSGIVSMT